VKKLLSPSPAQYPLWGISPPLAHSLIPGVGSAPFLPGDKPLLFDHALLGTCAAPAGKRSFYPVDQPISPLFLLLSQIWRFPCVTNPPCLWESLLPF